MISPEPRTWRSVFYAVLWLGLIPVSLLMPRPSLFARPIDWFRLAVVVLIVVSLFLLMTWAMQCLLASDAVKQLLNREG